MSFLLAKDTFLENLMKLAMTGMCSSDAIFPQVDREIASLLLWWYEQHPHALPDTLKDFSEIPWHVEKAIGHLMFSQDRDMIVRRKTYRDTYAKREWKPWEEAFREDFGERNLWEYAFDTARNLIHEIEVKEDSDGDIIQSFFNFQLLHETVIPLPRSCPDAFPAREFNDLVWMNWKARALFREERGFYPNDVGEPTISLCERKRPENNITALYIVRRDYRDIGDVIAAFGGYDKNPVGDLTGMAWTNGMKEKSVPVLALAGFFLDTFRPEEIELSPEILNNLPKDPLI